MKKTLIKFFSLAFFFLSICAVLVPNLVFSQQNTKDTGYQIMRAASSLLPETITPTVNFGFGGSGSTKPCKVVSTNTTYAFFVPTKFGDTEWTAFTATSSRPANVTAGCCGDGNCTNAVLGETPINCPPDCQVTVFCGDSVCEGSETAISCPYDCTYGACLKDSNEVGWISNCQNFFTEANCDPLHCIWNLGNGGFCTAKAAPSVETCNAIQVGATCTATWGCIWNAGMHRIYWWCTDGICSSSIGENVNTCPQDCGGLYCGDNMCNNGENCSTCGADCVCPPVCGDSVCETGEDCCSCSGDCGTCNQVCSGPSGCQLYDRRVTCESAGLGCSWGLQLCN
ncbi:MAG: hypothetical protein WCN88_00010 [Candidatus Falkowbacteria bacterium]